MAGTVTQPPYSAISLYSGAGGLDLGFSRGGFDIRWAIDSDPFAVETYNANLEPRAVCGDVLRIDPPSALQPTLVIGGPPCQGFSVIGRMDPTDPRSRHVDYFFDVVGHLQPRAFVMENVKALATSPRWAAVRDRLLDRASALGYERCLLVLNAKDFNVPQSRERMFLIGIRGALPERPIATTPGRPPTVRSALESLPRFGEPGNDATCSARVVPASKPVMRPTAHRGSLLFNGSGRPLELDGPAKTLPASMGGNATPIIDQKELEGGAEPWVIEYHRRLQGGEAPLKSAPDRLRRITVQEAAALQSFPAGWAFAGPRVSQYRQVGNAVPPNLAEAVALSVRGVLERQDDAAGTTATQARGRKAA
ncbi:MAG: DNA cytosine methyltransferase [Actinomycetota bacterium]